MHIQGVSLISKDTGIININKSTFSPTRCMPVNAPRNRNPAPKQEPFYKRPITIMPTAPSATGAAVAAAPLPVCSSGAEGELPLP